jgi:monoamine oxidase
LKAASSKDFNQFHSRLIDVTYLAEVDAFPNLLSFFMIGERVTNFDETSDEKIIDDLMWLLERVLGGELPRPVNSFRSTWTSQQNFLGAYSYLSMDSTRHNVSHLDLADSLVNDQGNAKIFFAGEATDVFYSYANGAVSSGWRAAEEVLANL